jgi:hypothetical protein
VSPASAQVVFPQASVGLLQSMLPSRFAFFGKEIVHCDVTDLQRLSARRPPHYCTFSTKTKAFMYHLSGLLSQILSTVYYVKIIKYFIAGKYFFSNYSNNFVFGTFYASLLLNEPEAS